MAASILSATTLPSLVVKNQNNQKNTQSNIMKNQSLKEQFDSLQKNIRI